MGIGYVPMSDQGMGTESVVTFEPASLEALRCGE